MRLVVVVIVSLLSALAASACGLDVEVDRPPGTPIDMRVPIPPGDPAYVDVPTAEAVIQPGEDKMLCYHVANDRGELAIDGLGALQASSYGHHLAVFTTSDPRPPGTLEDCTSPAANAPLRWFVLTFGQLPAGSAIHIPAGMHYVVQFHYINTGEEPILVRDVIRLHRTDLDAVTRWVATLILTDLDFQLPPGPSKRSWDCTIAEDRELLVVTGHMHELGTRFTLEIGANAAQMAPLYTASPWEPHYRDNAPVTSFYAEPLPLRAGTVLRTTCEWTNTTGHTVGFPVEMCTTFAYVGGAREPVQCTPR